MTTRVAVFSDIHGNPYACEAVLTAIEADGEFDLVVAAGDYCSGGSDPAPPGYHDAVARYKCGETHRLDTTLLDPARYPVLGQVCAYHERWVSNSSLMKSIPVNA